MPKERERTAQVASVRLSLASGFLTPLSCGLRRGRATVLPLRGGDPVDNIFVLPDLAEVFHLGGEHTRPRVCHAAPSTCESPSHTGATLPPAISTSFRFRCVPVPIRPVHARPMESAPQSLIGAPWPRRGDTPIRPVHARPMESASQSLIDASWASADRNAERAIASLPTSQSASRMAEGNPPLRANSMIGSQDLRLADFETRVRLVPSQSPQPDQPFLAYGLYGWAGISIGNKPFSGRFPLQYSFHSS